MLSPPGSGDQVLPVTEERDLRGLWRACGQHPSYRGGAPGAWISLMSILAERSL